MCRESKTYYYDETKTFSENFFVYQCDVLSIMVKLYNKSNVFAPNAKMVYKNDGRVYHLDFHKHNLTVEVSARNK
jgi:hypothetical protein